MPDLAASRIAISIREILDDKSIAVAVNGDQVRLEMDKNTADRLISVLETETANIDWTYL